MAETPDENPWAMMLEWTPEDWQGFNRVMQSGLRNIFAREEKRKLERIRLVGHLESLDALSADEAQRIRERIQGREFDLSRLGKRPRPARRRKAFPSLRAQVQWANENFDAIWMYRVVFGLYPNGAFRLGRPGASHMEIWGTDEAEEYGDVEATEDALGWDFLAYENFQGHIICHPEYGQIEQWPIRPGTAREQPWVTEEMKERVRDRARRMFEQYGPGTKLHPSLERLPEG